MGVLKEFVAPRWSEPPVNFQQQPKGPKGRHLRTQLAATFRTARMSDLIKSVFHSLLVCMLLPSAMLIAQEVTSKRSAPAIDNAQPTPDSSIDEIRTRISTFEAERDMLKSRFTPDDFVVRRLDEQLAGYRRLLEGDTEHSLTAIHLRHAEAGRMARRLHTLFPELEELIIADGRTNSILFRSNAEQRRIIQGIAEASDKEAGDSESARGAKSTQPSMIEIELPADPAFAEPLRKIADAIAANNEMIRLSNAGTVASEPLQIEAELSIEPDVASDVVKIVIEKLAKFGIATFRLSRSIEDKNTILLTATENTPWELTESLQRNFIPPAGFEFRIDRISIDMPISSNGEPSSALSRQGKTASKKEEPQTESTPYSEFMGDSSSSPTTSIAESRRRLNDLEQPVLQLAEKVRAAETSLGKDHPDAVEQRAELRALVQNTFAERQEIQRAELAEFTRRLERMRRSIETRDKIGDKIVDRRVEVLLSAPSAHTPNSTNSFRRGNTSTTDRKDLSFIPWKVPKNSPRLEISPTAWGESVHGLRAAMAVTDGPGELAGLQQLHLVVQNLSNVPIQISDTGWSSGFQMAVHVTRSSGEQVETLRPEKKIMFAPSSSSHLLESGETVVLATALIGRGIDSNPNDSVDLLISDHRPQTTENRESYRVGTSVMVPQDAGLDKKFRLHTGKVSLEFPTIPVDKHDVAIDQRVSVPPKSEPRQTTDRGISVAEANDQTSPPQSDAEKAIARLVLVFFQDEARRAVPGLMIDHGAETLILTAGPATIVPDGVAHVKDRAYLEFPETVDVEAGFINTKTTDIFFHRAKSGLTTFKLEKTVDLEIGDGLSAILLSGEPTLRVTPEVAHISALNQATSFSLATHKFRHEFTGLIQIDQRLPEGTPLFKNGELAGITLLGTRFMKDDVQGSYVVPTSRVLEVLQQVKTK